MRSTSPEEDLPLPPSKEEYLADHLAYDTSKYRPCEDDETCKFVFQKADSMKIIVNGKLVPFTYDHRTNTVKLNEKL